MHRRNSANQETAKGVDIVGFQRPINSYEVSTEAGRQDDTKTYVGSHRQTYGQRCTQNRKRTGRYNSRDPRTYSATQLLPAVLPLRPAANATSFGALTPDGLLLQRRYRNPQIHRGRILSVRSAKGPFFQRRRLCTCHPFVAEVERLSCIGSVYCSLIKEKWRKRIRNMKKKNEAKVRKKKIELEARKRRKGKVSKNKNTSALANKLSAYE